MGPSLEFAGNVRSVHRAHVTTKGSLVLRMLHFLFTDPQTGDGQPFFDMMSGVRASAREWCGKYRAIFCAGRRNALRKHRSGKNMVTKDLKLVLLPVGCNKAIFRRTAWNTGSKMSRRRSHARRQSLIRMVCRIRSGGSCRFPLVLHFPGGKMRAEPWRRRSENSDQREAAGTPRKSGTGPRLVGAIGKNITTTKQ